MFNTIEGILLTCSSFIIVTIILIPYLLYRFSSKEIKTYKEWIQSIGFSIQELVFILVNLILITLFNYFYVVFGFIVGLYMIGYIHNRKPKDDETFVPKTNKYIKAFFLVFTVYLIFIIINSRFDLISDNESLLRNTLLLLPINGSILFMYVFKVSFKDFKWNINIKILLVVIVLFLVLRVLPTLLDVDYEGNVTFVYFVTNLGFKIYNPAFIEEIIFRGLLLTGLIGCGFGNSKSNMMQAVIFGLIHVFSHDSIDLFIILGTSLQTFMGYLFGRLYLYTKSLTPNIVLHALQDIL